MVFDRNAYYRNYWKTHPEQYAKQIKRATINSKKWSKEHPEKRKEFQRKADKKFRLKLKLSIFELLKNKCVRCDFSDIRALQIDHINGGGNKEKKSFGGSTVPYYQFILAQIKNGSKDYQLLCANCNWIKRFERNETNHI